MQEEHLYRIPAERERFPKQKRFDKLRRTSSSTDTKMAHREILPQPDFATSFVVFLGQHQCVRLAEEQHRSAQFSSFPSVPNKRAGVHIQYEIFACLV